MTLSMAAFRSMLPVPNRPTFPESSRRVFAVGKLGSWSDQNGDKPPPVALTTSLPGTPEAATSPCNNGNGPHEGESLDGPTFDAAGGIWKNMGTCSLMKDLTPMTKKLWISTSTQN